MTLTITGIGKLNSAAAVSYHGACFNTSAHDIWLNIGIAGHKKIDIGEIRLINKITDKHNKINWYPQILFNSPCPCTSLLTLDEPSVDYSDILFDMEASGFYQIASRLGTSELIHCIKIVSDNIQQATYKVSIDNVKKLISSNIKTIVSIIDLLKPISETIKSITDLPENYALFIKQWHFTESQRIQLKKLLRQWQLRLPNKNLAINATEIKTGSAFLNYVYDQLNHSPFKIY